MLKTFDVYGEVGEGRCTVEALRAMLDLGEPTDALEIRIYSDGGDALCGFGLYNLILHHKGPTVAVIDGIAGSAATMPMIAAKRIKMHRAAMLYLHLPWLRAKTDIESADRNAATLKQTTAIMVRAYMDRSGRSEAEVMAWLRSDRLWGPDEALAMGLVDEIIETPVRATAQRVRLAGAVMARLRAAPRAALTCVAKPKATKPKGQRMNRDQICEKLGLDMGASVEEIASAAVAYCGSEASGEDKIALMKAIMSPSATEPDGDEAPDAKASGDEDKEDPQMKALLAECARLRAAAGEAESAEDKAKKAVAEGRWPEAQKDILVKAYKSGENVKLFAKGAFTPRSSEFFGAHGKPRLTSEGEEKRKENDGGLKAKKDAEDILAARDRSTIR